MEVLTAYLNPAEQVSEFRAAIARLTESAALADEPDLRTADASP